MVLRQIFICHKSAWFPLLSARQHVPCFLWEVQWPNGQCVRSQRERSRLEPSSGTLCCVLGQDTPLSQCLSPLRSVKAETDDATNRCDMLPRQVAATNRQV